MEKTGIFIIVILIAFVVIIFVFWLQFSKPKLQIYSNTTELYSLFTPYMQETVDSHLQTIECDPKEYYYQNSSVCFVCEKMDACFGYAWITRADGNKMNPRGMPYLVNFEKVDVKVANFYNDGLASLFDCKEKDKEKLECDGVSFVVDGLEVKMVLNNPDEIENVSRRICGFYNKTEVKCKGLVCECDGRIISVKDGYLFITKVVR